MPSDIEKAVILGSTILGSAYLCSSSLDRLGKINWDDFHSLPLFHLGNPYPSIAFNAIIVVLTINHFTSFIDHSNQISH